MPTQSPPQPSAPESSAKPAQPSTEAPRSGPDAAAAKPAPEGTLFHLLVERGWDARLAYNADQRIRTMTSEIVAAALEPLMAELRQIRETMADFVTRADLQRELAERETRLVKWVFGALLAQTAVIVGLVTLLR